ncbi:hypothetical protein Prudu_004026, partial [Prunus dulcis]
EPPSPFQIFAGTSDGENFAVRPPFEVPSLAKASSLPPLPSPPLFSDRKPANGGGDDVKTSRNCRRRRRRFRPSRATPSLGTGTPTTHTQQAGPSQGQAAWDYLLKSVGFLKFIGGTLPKF